MCLFAFITLMFTSRFHFSSSIGWKISFLRFFLLHLFSQLISLEKYLTHIRSLLANITSMSHCEHRSVGRWVGRSCQRSSTWEFHAATHAHSIFFEFIQHKLCHACEDVGGAVPVFSIRSPAHMVQSLFSIGIAFGSTLAQPCLRIIIIDKFCFLFVHTGAWAGCCIHVFTRIHDMYVACSTLYIICNVFSLSLLQNQGKRSQHNTNNTAPTSSKKRR